MVAETLGSLVSKNPVPFCREHKLRKVRNIDPIFLVLGTIATIASVVLTLLIAKKQGIFKSAKLVVSLFDLIDNGNARPELVVGGPHSEKNILTPFLVKILNNGTETAYNLEVSIKSDSSAIVNHPSFFISPIATDSSEAIEGNVVYLGNGVFRRIFKISHLHPGKSVQLNNAGLPRNLVSTDKPVNNSSLSVAIYEQGKASKNYEFGIWALDTTGNSFHKALRWMAETEKRKFKSSSILWRFIARLFHRQNEHELRLMEITEFRSVSIAGEPQEFVTVDKFDLYYGKKFVTGYLFVDYFGIM